MWDHTLWEQLFLTSSFKSLHQFGTFGFRRYSSILKSFHRFSLGFMSGLRGHWRTLTFLLWSHSRVDLAACLSPVGADICWPHSQAFGTQKHALLEICLCLDPCIVLLDLWPSLPILFGRVWRHTIVLWAMDGVRGLISSTQFQQTLCIPAEVNWILFHQVTESFASCSVFHMCFNKFQAVAMCCFTGEAKIWIFGGALSVLAKLFHHDWRTLEFCWSGLEVLGRLPYQGLSWQVAGFGQKPALGWVLVF